MTHLSESQAQASVPGRAALPGVVWATAWVSFLTDMSTEMIYALLPVFYASTLGLGTLWQGLIEGAAEALASLTKLFSGHWSDRTGGRKWWMVGGYSLSTISKPLLALAGGGWTVLALRLADRLGKGVRGAPRDALISGTVDAGQRGRAFGVQRAMDHAGAMLGALLASAIVYWQFANLRHLFWWTLLPGGAAVAIIVIFVREKAAKPASTGAAGATPQSLWQAYREQPAALKGYLAVMAVFALGNSTDALLLLRARDQAIHGGWSEHLAAAAMPLLWAWLHVVKSLSSTWCGGLSDRLGRVRLIRWGWMLYALVYAGFAVWDSVAAPWVLFSLYGFYYGLVEGPERALIADICPNQNRHGSAYGLYYFVVGLSALPASLLCGGLWQFFGPVPAFVTGAALALLAAALLGGAVRSHA